MIINIYSHLGYNLKITDMQAAVGLAQLNHLQDFIDSRKKNFSLLKKGLSGLENKIMLPEATRNSDPSWFGFSNYSLSTKLKRKFFNDYFMNDKKIGTRLISEEYLTKFNELSKNLKFKISGQRNK